MGVGLMGIVKVSNVFWANPLLVMQEGCPDGVPSSACAMLCGTFQRNNALVCETMQ